MLYLEFTGQNSRIMKDIVKESFNDVYSKTDELVSATLKEATRLEVHLSPRMRSMGGYAFWKKNKINLNYRLLIKNRDEIRKTFLHELAHIIQDILYPGSKPHGKEWKSVMIAIGEPPEIYHNMNTKALKSKRKLPDRFTYKCPCCNIVYQFLPREHKNHQEQTASGSRGYACGNKCGESLKFIRKLGLQKNKKLYGRR